MVLKLVYIIIVMIGRMYPLTCAQYQNQAIISAQNQKETIARFGCDSKCGNVSIPYPFGMRKPKCYASEPFEIECRHNKNGSQGEKLIAPYLKYINLEVMYIDLEYGTVGIKNPIFHPGCDNTSTGINLEGGPFVYSQDYNSFVTVGCQNAALLLSNDTILTACVSVCYDDPKNANMMDVSSCRGKYCCETSLPPYLQAYNVSVGTVEVKSEIKPECGYGLIKADYFQFNYVYDEYNSSYWVPTLGNLKKVKDVPAVLQWEIPIHMPNNSFPEFRTDADSYANYNCSYTNVTSAQSKSGWRCTCKYGFKGNPYLDQGCKLAMEDSPERNKTRLKWAIGVSSSLGTVILLLGLWWLHKVIRKSIATKRKEKFFKQNGGLLLKQRLSSGEVNVDKIKLFSLKDLQKATDHFNINRVLGKGGQGTVYKGMLVDGKIVAVKKFKVNGKVEEFINEFVILSQINHRNVTEIPLIVYEFIPNGLYEYLHGQNELPMTWDMRLRIASEVAGALFFLHSAASQPIYHRDVNSRKSDVYSFEVVLVELLTGQKPISSVKEQELKSLAPYFLLCMAENRLFDIIDERVIQEGEKENIIVVSNLARRCLQLNGKKRPTMKVTLELESIQKLEKQSNAQEHHEELELAGIEDSQI
uniref:Protein kinase domain-containing protein n=1 Tax=Glycine max TaxID=3847 RepID=A0A0R0G8W2_SOYBN